MSKKAIILNNTSSESESDESDNENISITQIKINDYVIVRYEMENLLNTG